MLGEKKLSISICKWLPRSVSNHGWGDQTRSNDLTSLLFREILGFLVLWENILVPVKVKEIIRKISRASDDKQHSFTLDLKWNLWLVEGIQPIYHSLWIRCWNDNPIHICSRYRVRSLLSPVRVVFSNFANLKHILVFFVGYHELSNFEFVLSASAFIFDRQLKPRYWLFLISHSTYSNRCLLQAAVPRHKISESARLYPLYQPTKPTQWQNKNVVRDSCLNC